MTEHPIGARYAQAVFEAAQAEGQVEEVRAQLAAIGELMRGSPELRELMRNPDVDPEEKIGIVQRILKASWAPLMSAFVRMVVSRWRAEFFPDIMDAFQLLVDEDRRRLRVTVRSARPLSEPALARLRAALKEREQKEVDLSTEVAPDLLGGFQLFFGNRVIDGSVREQLHELRQRLAAVRVT